MKLLLWKLRFSKHIDRRTNGQTYRQTDRHDEAKSRFLQFCERN